MSISSSTTSPWRTAATSHAGISCNSHICLICKQFRAANNETRLSFEASLKVVEEEEEEEQEVEYEEEVVEEYEADYEQEGEYKELFSYEEEEEVEWDWRSRAGDLASEKDENWDD